jgi:hypothetical protein
MDFQAGFRLQAIGASRKQQTRTSGSGLQALGFGSGLQALGSRFRLSALGSRLSLSRLPLGSLLLSIGLAACSGVTFRDWFSEYVFRRIIIFHLSGIEHRCSSHFLRPQIRSRECSFLTFLQLQLGLWPRVIGWQSLRDSLRLAQGQCHLSAIR